MLISDKCHSCDNIATWVYLPVTDNPIDRYTCDEHVNRGCECNYHYTSYGETPNGIENVNWKWIVKDKSFVNLDDKDREYPCVEYDNEPEGYMNYDKIQSTEKSFSDLDNYLNEIIPEILSNDEKQKIKIIYGNNLSLPLHMRGIKLREQISITPLNPFGQPYPLNNKPTMIVSANTEYNKVDMFIRCKNGPLNKEDISDITINELLLRIIKFIDQNKETFL